MKHGGSMLTATDISAVMSLAQQMQPRSAWGQVQRASGHGLDGFVVLDPRSAAPLFTIGRTAAGCYLARDDFGCTLAAGPTIDDVLRHFRSSVDLAAAY